MYAPPDPRQNAFRPQRAPNDASIAGRVRGHIALQSTVLAGGSNLVVSLDWQQQQQQPVVRDAAVVAIVSGAFHYTHILILSHQLDPNSRTGFIATELLQRPVNEFVPPSFNYFTPCYY